MIGTSLRANRRVTEYDVQRFILDEFDREGLTCDNSPPMVGVNQHAADPHFEVSAKDSTPIQVNDRVLIDLWARENSPKAIYYDITWCGYMGKQPDAEYQAVFDIVVAARNATKRFIAERVAAGQPVHGWEADNVAATTSPGTATAKFFVHRTGHSIHKEVHGNGANLDNLETKDERRLISGTCFSIEPGIYMYKKAIGVRTEIDVLIDGRDQIEVFGPEQEKLILLE